MEANNQVLDHISSVRFVRNMIRRINKFCNLLEKFNIEEATFHYPIMNTDECNDNIGNMWKLAFDRHGYMKTELGRNCIHFKFPNDEDRYRLIDDLRQWSVEIRKALDTNVTSAKLKTRYENHGIEGMLMTYYGFKIKEYEQDSIMITWVK